jgi:catechol 2,3-dioxygenase-like lactoylglutathione lyase family enzyme
MAMGLNALHHVTVKTDDLEATRDFYSGVLGLEVGFRPDLDFPGYWLYCGPTPVVHLVPRENAIGGGPSSDTGPFDPIAVLAADLDGIKARLEAKGVKYRENHIQKPPIDQLFFPDNNNVMVELNFPR